MKKQKKQMILLGIILAMLLVSTLIICLLPQKEENSLETYQVTNYEKDKIMKLSFLNQSGTYTFTKKGDNWVYEQDNSLSIDGDKIESLLAKVVLYDSENKISDVIDHAAYGLEEPTKKILISTGSETTTFLIGDYNNITGTYYMCLENDMSTVYTMKSSEVTAFDKTVDDFVVEETSEDISESGTTIE